MNRTKPRLISSWWEGTKALKLTKEDPGHNGMGPVALRVGNIAEGQDVELLLAASSSGIDGNQNGSNEQEAEEAGDDDDLEEAHVEVGVQGLPVKKVGVLENGEVFEPSQRLVGVGRSLLSRRW